jgi:outer membrane usher protein FimD/PapC
VYFEAGRLGIKADTQSARVSMGEVLGAAGITSSLLGYSFSRFSFWDYRRVIRRSSRWGLC